MRWSIFFMLLVAAAFLEAGDLLNIIALGKMGVRPSPLMWLLVYTLCVARFKPALYALFWMGLALDICAGAFLGAHMISALLFGSIAQRFCEAMPARRLSGQAALGLAMCLTVLFAGYWLSAARGGGWSGSAHLYLWWKSVYTAALTPIAMHFLRRLDRLTGLSAPSRSVWANA